MFDCDDVVNMDEYVWCNINGEDGFNFTQPVMLQRIRNEFSVPKQVPTTPEIPVKTPIQATEEDVDPPKETTYLCKGVGKLIHMMRW